MSTNKPSQDAKKTEQEKTPEQIISDLQAEVDILTEEKKALEEKLEEANKNLKIYADEAVKRNEQKKASEAAKAEAYELSDEEFKAICIEKRKASEIGIPKEKVGKFVVVQYLNHSSLRKNKTAPNPGDVVLCRKEVAKALEAQGKVEILTKEKK